MKQVEQRVKKEFGRAHQVSRVRWIDRDPRFAAMVVVRGVEDAAAVAVISAANRRLTCLYVWNSVVAFSVGVWRRDRGIGCQEHHHEQQYENQGVRTGHEEPLSCAGG